MKKSILNFGKALMKDEQKQINGGDQCSGQCVGEYYYCSDCRIIWVGPCKWHHIAPCS